MSLEGNRRIVEGMREVCYRSGERKGERERREGEQEQVWAAPCSAHQWRPVLPWTASVPATSESDGREILR